MSTRQTLRGVHSQRRRFDRIPPPPRHLYIQIGLHIQMLRSPGTIANCMMKFQCFDKLTCNSFSTLPQIPLPSAREIHLWYIKPRELKNEAVLNQYVEILSRTEKQTVFRLQDEELRKEALLSRALVRTTIARYQVGSHVSPESLKFVKNSRGKPEVDWQHRDDWHPPHLHFNLSHTSSLIACGVTIDSPIGIDVEEKNRVMKNNILSFARRFFSKHEMQVLSDIPDPLLQHQEFVKIWTLKEAYVKALGCGFSAAPFNTFTIRINDSEGRRSLENSVSEVSEIVVNSFNEGAELTSNWEFMLLDLASSHYAAICTEKDQGKQKAPKKLMVWKTIPFLEDKLVSGTEEVMIINGST